MLFLSLNTVSTLKIEDLMNDLKQQYTIIIVTHNMQQAARISDRTAFFMFGKIIEYDRTLDLFNNPKDKKTEAYVTGRFG